MGKRSDFVRVERDFYPTPYEAIVPLLSHLKEKTWFHEPCAGDGSLIEHLKKHGHKCHCASDIEPQAEGIFQQDALEWIKPEFEYGDTCFITNPPWNRKILHPLIEHLSNIAPTWLLFDADWMHTKQSIPYLTRLKKVVSIGRVKWIKDSKGSGKDNSCWYLFDKNESNEVLFYGRTE